MLDPCPLPSSQPDINLDQDLIAYIDNNCHSSHSHWTVNIPFHQIFQRQLHLFLDITEFVGRNKPLSKKKSSADLRYFCSSAYPSSSGFTGVHFDVLVRDVQKEALKVGFTLIRNGKHQRILNKKPCMLQKLSCSRYISYKDTYRKKNLTSISPTDYRI